MKNYDPVVRGPEHGRPTSEDLIPHVIDVRELLNGKREVRLRLDGELYRLRITSKGKLILTK